MKIIYIKLYILYNIMYFCPNCSYIFDIYKSVNTTPVNDTRISIKKSNDLFKLLENNSDLSKYKAEFTKEELNKNKKYQKIKDDEKYLINIIFENILSSDAEFHCNNCNLSNKINETTLLYNINFNENNTNNNFTLEENKLMTKNPLYQHTHDYICKNIDCETHKNNLIKDAIYVKNNNNYNGFHICCICYYNW